MSLGVVPPEAVPLVRPPERATVDVAELPDVVFGYRGTVWWGTMLFALIESATVMVSLFTYFYLRRNFDAWPPPRIVPPNLEIGTASMAVLLLSLVPTWLMGKAASAMNLAKVRRWKIVVSLFSAAIVLLRALELGNLNTRWDETAYGSVVWAVIGVHTTLLVVDVFESWAETALVWRGPVETKHFADFEDSAFYWWFTVMMWVPAYVVLYLYPRWS